MSKIAMISQPMKGKTDAQIEAQKAKAVAYLTAHGYEVADTFFKDEHHEAQETPEVLTAKGIRQIPVHFLAKSLESMSRVDAVYFCAGWETARGCFVEHIVATNYGLKCLYEVEN